MQVLTTPNNFLGHDFRPETMLKVPGACRSPKHAQCAGRRKSLSLSLSLYIYIYIISCLIIICNLSRTGSNAPYREEETKRQTYLLFVYVLLLLSVCLPLSVGRSGLRARPTTRACEQRLQSAVASRDLLLSICLFILGYLFAFFFFTVARRDRGRAQGGHVRCSAGQGGAVRCGAVRCGAVRCGAVRCGAVRVRMGVYGVHGTYVCMHVWMHVCMYAGMQVCRYACMHTCTYARMYACTYERMHVCMYACMHACMHACTYARMHVCWYVCVFVCMNA